MKKFNNFKKSLLLSAAMLSAFAVGCSNEESEISDIEEKSVAESSVADTLEKMPLAEAPKNESPETEKLSNKNTDLSNIFSERDLNPDFSHIDSNITMKGSSAECDNDSVIIDGSKITITKEGVYKFSGKLDNGQIIINAPDSKVQLILDNADISCSNSSAIYGIDSKKIFVSLAPESVNNLSDGEYTYPDEITKEPDSCIFSKDSITINGSGTLNINSVSSGIHSKDDVVVTGGNININSACEGIKGKDYVAIADGIFNIVSGEDGIKSTNTTDSSLGFVFIENGSFDIDSARDGIQAETDVIIKTVSHMSIKSGGGNENSTKTHSDDMGFGGMTPPDNFNPGDFDFSNITPPDNFNPDDMGGNFKGGRFNSDFNPENMTPPDNFNPDDMGGNFGGGRFEKSKQDDTTNENSISTKGIKGGNSVNIYGGYIVIDSADDAVHSNGDFNMTGGSLEIMSGNKGVHADLQAIIRTDGSLLVKKSYEGIEATVIEINNADVNITASDDGLNASDGSAQIGLGSYSENVQIIINGGWVEINADGDGIDSNGDMTINDGVLIVNGAPNGANSALDSNGEITINGGTVIAAGMHDMLELPSDKSAQCVISVTFDSTQEADTFVNIKEADISYTSVKRFDNIIISSPELKKGETYTILLNNDEYDTIKTDDTVSTLGTQSTFGNFGGGMYGGRRGNKGDFQPPINENGEIEMPDRNFDKNFNEKKSETEPQET